MGVYILANIYIYEDIQSVVVLLTGPKAAGMCICMSIYICMGINIYVCMYVYMYL
jgi:hypothetical protein